MSGFYQAGANVPNKFPKGFKFEPGTYDAPCIGGPMDGQKLTYTIDHKGEFSPDEYTIVKDDIAQGRYEFQRAQHLHKPHGDQWVWHPYVGGM